MPPLLPIRTLGAAGAALVLLVLLSLAGAIPTATARAAGEGSPFECRWTDEPVRLDGKADDPAWRAAQPIDRFGQPWARTAAKGKTSARLLWDRDYLYFTARMDDADLFAPAAERDGRLWEGDVFELFLKPAADRPGYFEFEFNPAGAVLDMFIPQRGDGGFEKYRADGEFNVELEVAPDGTLNRHTDRDRRWTVEGRIPWRDFLRAGGRPAPGEEWGFALCRYDYAEGREPELSTCAPLTEPSFHRYEDYAKLRFVGPGGRATRPFGIAERTPLTTSRVAGTPDPLHPYRVHRLYPNLRPGYPVTAVPEPGSDRLIAIVQQYPGGPSSIVRFRDTPDSRELEVLLPQSDRLAYDLVFHPRFQENGYLYVGNKLPFSAPSEDKRMRISRFTLRGPERKLDPASEVSIIDWWSDGHDGGAMAFGLDGTLFITTGDGTSDSDTKVTGQDTTLLLAKVLRIDVDHPDPGKHYSVPKDNPFVGRPDFRPETWAYGFRNPWRMTLDRKTGHLWVAMNGQDLWETAYLVKKGANYGWSVYEGSHPFYPNRKLGPTPFTPPTLEHPHSEARSLMGGIVYYGERYPELHGAYIYGDYSTGKIWAAKHDGERLLWHREIADCALQLTAITADTRGEILITDIGAAGGGAFYTLDPTPKDLPPSTFPRRLSESGLFRSVRGHVVEPALVPFSVNAPLWSDGAHKERFIALPGADSQIDYTDFRGWNFPDGSVLVKSFALERQEGRPASRQWVETRFLTKQEGEWVGYSYAWNEEQTDAVLVESAGQDREYRVRVPRSREYPDGYRKQMWRYPSRAECMVCHSRAANFVLGLNTLQFNREESYNGVRDNQLRVLERLGMLKSDWGAEAREALRRDAAARGLSGPAVDEYVAKHSPAGGQRQPPASPFLAKSPDLYPRLVDPYDRKADLDRRARSYLHANCSPCHVEAGGGNAQIELEFGTAPERMRLFDVPPVHHTFGLPDARLVAPGAPERSVLLRRLSTRGEGFMPPLATREVDRPAVALMEAWIRQMKR